MSRSALPYVGDGISIRSVDDAVMVTGVFGGTLLPFGVLVIIGVLGAELATVKLISVQSEYAP